MKKNLKSIIEEIISAYGLTSLSDVLEIIPKFMCHITQEPHVFNTYPIDTMRLTIPKEKWEINEKIFKRYSDEIIPSISLEDYLKNFIKKGERLPCFCSEIGDVAAALASKVIKKRVYVVRRTFVTYLIQPSRRHCFNAYVEEERIRYFDAAVYNQVFNKKTGRLVSPDLLPEFNASDIDKKFFGENSLQSNPFQRTISLQAGIIIDNFYPNPDQTGLVDEYQHIFNI